MSSKHPLVLLHGALGSKKQFGGITKQLSVHYEVHAINFTGHGGSTLPEEYNCELFAEDVIRFIKTLAADKQCVNIFGYSMGGYVATYMALHYPAMVNKVLALGTKYGWEPTSGAIEANKLDVAKLKEKAPLLCEQLQQEHAPQNWEDVVVKTREMMQRFAENPPLKEKDYHNVLQPLMVALGDRDKTAGVTDSANVCSKLPNGKLLVLPGTPHPLEKIDFKLLEPFVLSFFNRSYYLQPQT